MSTTRRGSASTNKPVIVIELERHYNTKIYTSGSAIFGNAVITTTRDMAFDSFEIILTGTSYTRLDFVQQFPTHSARTFLKLRMPIPASHMPEDNTFEGGHTYVIPFHFVVPHQLTIGACHHKCTNDVLRAQHLRLPPTLGAWSGDDQAPEMASIEYAIKARALKKQATGNTLLRLMEASRTLKVLPSLPEDAPLAITTQDERYCLSKSKTIRKNLLTAKTGKFSATASQPSAVMFSTDGHSMSSSSAHVKLAFTPASSEIGPPKINSLSGKLQSVTFFSAGAVNRFPDLGTRANWTAAPSLSYSATSSLFSKTIDAPSWEQHNSPNLRRDSGYSSLGVDETTSDTDHEAGRGRRGSKAKKSRISSINYTTTVDIPFTIPNDNQRFFVPTFHSCIVSRTYTLQLNMSVGQSNTSLTLYVPLQIGVENSPENLEAELPSFEAAMAQAEEESAAGHLQPRRLQMPSLELQGGSELPGYYDMRTIPISVS